MLKLSVQEARSVAAEVASQYDRHRALIRAVSSVELFYSCPVIASLFPGYQMSDPLQEDRGLIKVHAACVAMHAIWRPTPCHDIGIDGQIEFLEQAANVVSTGKIVAVQVKSGPSYFPKPDGDDFRYYPSAKHVRYWRALNIPVILVLHDPDADLTIYADVKPQLESDGPIRVSRHQRLTDASRTDILTACDRVEDPKRVLDRLKLATLVAAPEKTITGVEFLTSCLNPSHEYFEQRMARLQAVIEFAVDDQPTNGIGNDTYDFIQRCALICMGAKITDPFGDEYDNQWYELELVPDITVGLTPFGTLVADYLRDNAADYITVDTFTHNGWSDAPDVFEKLKTAAQAISDHLDGKYGLYAHPK